MHNSSRARERAKGGTRRTDSRSFRAGQNTNRPGLSVLLAGNAENGRKICSNLCQLPKIQIAATSSRQQNARHLRISARGNDFDGPDRATTEIHRGAHLAPSDPIRFTKWIEFCPLEKTTEKAVSKAIRIEICRRHRCPDVIVPDNRR